jgi:hypothetical protein
MVKPCKTLLCMDLGWSGCQWGTTQFPKGSAPCVPILTEIAHYDYEWLWLWLLWWYSWLSLTPLLPWISLVTSLIRSVIIHNPISLMWDSAWEQHHIAGPAFFFLRGAYIWKLYLLPYSQDLSQISPNLTVKGNQQPVTLSKTWNFE